MELAEVESLDKTDMVMPPTPPVPTVNVERWSVENLYDGKSLRSGMQTSERSANGSVGARAYVAAQGASWKLSARGAPRWGGAAGRLLAALALPLPLRFTTSGRAFAFGFCLVGFIDR